MHLPTEEGYYWLERPDCHPMPVEVKREPGGLVVSMVGHSLAIPLSSESFKGARFTKAVKPAYVPHSYCLDLPPRLGVLDVLNHGEALWGLRLALRGNRHFALYEWDPPTRSFVFQGDAAGGEEEVQRYLEGGNVEVLT